MTNTKISLISCELDLTANGLRSLSSQLKKHSYDTRLVLLPRLHENYTREILEQLYILVKDSALIGFSCINQSSNKVIQIIKYLKSKNNTQKILWGGIHATLNPDECLKYADIVCIGEGEEAILELVRAMEHGKAITRIKNLWVKHQKKVYKNGVRNLIGNINWLPFEDHDFKTQYVLVNDHIVNMDPKYLKFGLHNISNEYLAYVKGSFITMHTSRGCPYDCAYCCNYDLKRIYSDKRDYVRKRHIKNVLAEIKRFKNIVPELGYIWFTDDDFFIRTEDEIKCFSAEYKEKIGIPFMCYVTPPTFKKEKLDCLKKAGLQKVEIGVQTGSENLNKRLYNRDVSNSLVLKSAKLLDTTNHEYQFICASAFETKDDLLKTIKLIQDLPKPFYLRVFNMALFPGSHFYKTALGLNIVEDEKKGCGSLLFCDSIEHLKMKSNYPTDKLYLSYLLNFMRGKCNKIRYGRLPRFLLKPALNEKVINSAFALKVLKTLLKYSPYTITFSRLPYKVKAPYVKTYILLCRKIIQIKARLRLR